MDRPMAAIQWLRSIGQEKLTNMDIFMRTILLDKIGLKRLQARDFRRLCREDMKTVKKW